MELTVPSYGALVHETVFEGEVQSCRLDSARPPMLMLAEPVRLERLPGNESLARVPSP